MSLLRISHLQVDFTQGEQPVSAVRDLSLQIAAGEVLALVGESGSGKSVTAAAILGLLPAGQVKVQGQILFDGQPLLQQSELQLNQIRGHKIAMVFQNSLSTLDPSYAIGQQLQHNLKRLDPLLSRQQLQQQALHWLEKMKIKDAARVMAMYPHQLSGGMRQRVLIALAAMCKPALLIADEPTTALDAGVQQQILQLLKELCQQQNMAMLLISHDFGVVSWLSDRVAVMRNGLIVETNHTQALIRAPQHAYSKTLLQSVPQLNVPAVSKPKADSLPLLAANNISCTYSRRDGAGWWKKRSSFAAVDKLSFQLPAGEIVGIIGESGSGKSTLARILAQLIPATQGQVTYRQQPIHADNREQLLAFRQQVQMVFQDSLAAFNPRLRLDEQLIRAQLRLQSSTDRHSALQRAQQVFSDVGLHPSLLSRFPHQLSGGQRQRANIARALVVKPQCLILDEPTSALDVSVQAQVVELLANLHQQYQLSCLFISHNLALVAQFCQRILVMDKGQLVDDFYLQDIYHPQRHPVTQALLAAQLPLINDAADIEPKQLA